MTADRPPTSARGRRRAAKREAQRAIQAAASAPAPAELPSGDHLAGGAPNAVCDAPSPTTRVALNVDTSRVPGPLTPGRSVNLHCACGSRFEGIVLPAEQSRPQRRNEQTTMTSTTAKRLNDLRSRIKSLMDAAEAEGRDLTDGEAAEITTKAAELRATQAAAIAEGQAFFDAMKGSGTWEADPVTGETVGVGATGGAGSARYLDLSPKGRKGLASRLATRMVGVQDGRKALLPAGETVLSIPTLPTDPISQGKVPPNLLAVLPVVPISAGAQARYVQQTTRTNNAAPVAVGGLKPTSIYGLTPKDVELKVYAHLSEPVDRFMVEDANSLAVFLGQELLYGLTQAVEADVVAGDGADGGIVGLLAVSGIISQPFATDILTTTRNALTTAEQTGYNESLVYILSAADWATAELSRAQTGGTFDFPGAPVDAAARRLWGQPVVVVLGLPAGTGVLLDRSAVGVYVDRQGTRVDWGSPSDQWSRNQVTARCEGRFDLAVFQPQGIVQIATAAATP